MANTSNRNTCAPAAVIPARAPRRRLVNARPFGSAPDQYLHPTTVEELASDEPVARRVTRALIGLYLTRGTLVVEDDHGVEQPKRRGRDHEHINRGQTRATADLIAKYSSDENPGFLGICEVEPANFRSSR